MPLAPGSRLGRYEVLDRLGQGGMGTVYRARDEVLGRLVAVKVLAEHLAQQVDLRARFEREARAVAALSHPAVLAIHDFGVEEGVLYAVTELLDGSTLRDVLSRGRLHWQEVRRIGIQVSEGLAAAHEKAIVHRDLKPENVFLTRDGRVKVLDFGLAKQSLGPADTEALTAASGWALTAEGAILGTPGYMSPEQVRGEPTDPRCDVFAAGCLLFEALTGRRAFGRSSAAEALAAVLVETPPRPSSESPEVPAAFDAVVERCLARKPEGRYASGAELLAALEAIAETERPSLPPESRPRASLPKPRPVRPARPQPSLAVLPFRTRGGEPALDYLSEGLTDGLIAELSRWHRLRVMARSTVFRFRGEADAVAVGRDLGVGAVLSGQLRHEAGDVFVSVELVDVKEGWCLWGESFRRPLARALSIETEIAQGIGSALKVPVSSAHRRHLARRHRVDEEAHLLFLKGRYQWGRSTVESLRKAIALYEAAVERDPAYPEPYAGIAECWVALGTDRWGALPPAEALPRARAAARRALELHGGSIDAHVALGQAAVIEWRWEEAEAELGKAVALAPANPQALSWQSMLLTIQGRFEAAVERRHRALELDPLSLLQNADLGWTHFCARRYGEAVAQCRRALELEPAFSQALFWLGFSQVYAGDAAGAVTTYERAVAATGGAPTMRGALAFALASAGRTAEAEERWNALRSEAAGSHVPLVALVLPAIALRRTGDALDLLDRAADARASFLVGAEVYPFFDPLRNEARFEAIRERVGLAAVAV